MDRNMPLPGSFYKYPDGNILQIICIANNCNNKEKSVVYQKMYPPFDIWTEPFGSFMEEIGNNGKLEYGFVEGGAANVQTDISAPSYYMGNTASAVPEGAVITDGIFKEALLSGSIDRKIAGIIPDREIAERGFTELLDAKTYHEKYIIFTSLRKYLDKRLLNNIAVALDIVLDDGDEEEQYNSLLHCLQTFEHYETQRLR